MPRSLFPELIKEPTNFVKLTYREHYVCHHLLYMMYKKEGNKNAMMKMANAWFRMCKNTDGVHVSNRDYSLVRAIALNELHSCNIGGRRTDETKRKMSESQKGRVFTEEHRRHIREAELGEKGYWYGKHLPPEMREKISESYKGKQFTEEHRKNIGISKAGKNNPFYGKKRPPSFAEKMSIAIKGDRNPMFGRHWWTDGKNNISAKECPGDGWVRGRVQ